MPFHFPTLTGTTIRIRPLRRDDSERLAGLTSLETFKYYVTSVPTSDDTEGWQPFVDDILNTPTIHGQVIEDVQTGQILGMSNYLDIREIDLQVEVGMTWYIESRRGTALNPEAKLLLLTHAFETLGCEVVGLRTDNFNFVSQKAIEGIGAKKDGVLRHHQARRDGTVRDSVLYSILATEWPDVKRHLELRLARRSG